MTAVKKDLAATESTAFERGLDALGELLGFQVELGVGNQKAAPDSVWTLDREFAIGWEAKSDEKPDAAIAVSRVREAKGHYEWVKDSLKLKSTDGISVTNPAAQISAPSTLPRAALSTKMPRSSPSTSGTRV